MTPFGGYDMPVQYPLGILKEHLWTRDHAGLFDVSHMGPAWLDLVDKSGDGDADHRAVAALVEPLVSGDIVGLKPGQLRYTLLLNQAGGICDDLVIGRPAARDQQGRLYIVVNAGTKDGDFALIAASAGDRARLKRADDHALMALQGPAAADTLEAVWPGICAMAFMTFATRDLAGHNVTVARCGYTGEDGFEILAPAQMGELLWNRLLADPRVQPVGLGARDSLRLEAGLPLYGHDIDATTSPYEAGLAFAVSKRRLKSADFPGAVRLTGEQSGRLTRVRVGLRGLAGAPAREGAAITDGAGEAIGVVTSGGFSPTIGGPIAMGYVPPMFSAVGTRLCLIVRGKSQPAEVVALPFVPHRYVRQPAKF